LRSSCGVSVLSEREQSSQGSSAQKGTLNLCLWLRVANLREKKRGKKVECSKRRKLKGDGMNKIDLLDRTKNKELKRVALGCKAKNERFNERRKE